MHYTHLIKIVPIGLRAKEIPISIPGYYRNDPEDSNMFYVGNHHLPKKFYWYDGSKSQY